MKTMSGKKNGKQSKSADPIQAAIDYGIDISMLKDNVKRTPAERIRRPKVGF